MPPSIRTPACGALVLSGLLAVASCDRGPAPTLSAANEHATHPGLQSGLGELMLRLSDHQARLAASVNASNADLAGYELDELKEVLDDIRTAFPTHEKLPQPSATLISMYVEPPAVALEASLNAHDWSKAGAALASLTDGCNACHQTSGVGFIRIIVPHQSPVVNQDFASAAVNP